MELKLYNTLTRKKELFKPLYKTGVGLYTCGPTVYNFAHLGNLRTYLFEDILKRVLEYNGYQVKHVMNITDVGHLTSDADSGEDKMETGAKREKKTVWQIAKFYTKAFQQNLKDLNIEKPSIWVKATDHIKEQIDLILKLEKKGYTYKTADGIYFDSTLFKNYGKLARLDIKGLKAGARIKIKKEKRHPTDFALWKFSYPNGRSFDSSQDDAATRRQMEWNSPWGIGFPGWHLECSVMSTKYLGQPFDIHTGGVDHIAVHHTNEIAQSEAAFNKKMANFWLHGEFLILKDGKMAKSKGNFITLDTLIKEGFNPLTYRYLVLTSHYRSKLNFSLKSLKGADHALKNIYNQVSQLAGNEAIDQKIEKDFHKAINDDLDTPKAVAIIWQLLKSALPAGIKKGTLIEFDKVLGLGLTSIKKEKLLIPKEVKQLVQQREKARKQQDYKKADVIRKELEKAGYSVQDTVKGPQIKKSD